MDDYGSGYRYVGGQWRHETVSGKSYGASHTSVPDPITIPPRVPRTSHIDSKPWNFNDPEMKRKKRIYKYKAYTVEGNVKASVRRGLNWIKNKCSQIVHRYWVFLRNRRTRSCLLKLDPQMVVLTLTWQDLVGVVGEQPAYVVYTSIQLKIEHCKLSIFLLVVYQLYFSNCCIEFYFVIYFYFQNL